MSSRRATGLRARLGQYRHHRAFRIPPPAPDDVLRRELDALLAELLTYARANRSAPTGTPSATPAGTAASAPAGTAAGEPGPPPGEAATVTGELVSPDAVPVAGRPDEKALVEAATQLWRAQRRLEQPGEKPTSRSRQTSRFLRTCRDALADAGVIVQDHDGDAFRSGRSLEVLVFKEEPGLAGRTETVLQTVRPTVYINGHRVQMGQVVVGTPPGTQPGSPAQAARQNPAASPVQDSPDPRRSLAPDLPDLPDLPDSLDLPDGRPHQGPHEGPHEGHEGDEGLHEGPHDGPHERPHRSSHQAGDSHA